MSAERWMQELEMVDKVRKDVLAKERVQAAEQEVIRQDAEKRAWLRELCQLCGIFCHLKEGDENGN
jgi:hypothetical protein